MAYVVGYRCKHCGKAQGAHKAETYHCPLPGRRSFKDYHRTQVYEANEKKPITVPFLI